MHRINQITGFFTRLANDENVFWEAIKEIFEAIKRDYFTIQHGEYTNLGIDPVNQNGISIEAFIVFGMIGMVIACFAASFNKGVLGAFVRTVIRNECLSPESAKTLGELGFLKNTAVRSSLKKGFLKKFVRCVEDDNGTLISSENKNGTVAFNDAHFYIPEEDKYRAEVRFEGKRTHPIIYVIMIVVAIALSVFIIKVLPNLLSMLDEFVGSVSPGSDIYTGN